MIDRFRGMTFDDFAGTPAMLEFDTIVNPPTHLRAVDRQAFFSTMIIEHSHERGDVWHGFQYVAGFVIRDHRGDSKVWVHSDHRRKGIAEELIYQVLVRHGVGVRSQVRTPASHRLYRRVYDRIQRDIERIAA